MSFGKGEQLAGETRDLPAHALAHGKRRANRLLQQGMFDDELFGPATKGVPTRFADEETIVLEQTADMDLQSVACGFGL